MATTYTQAQYSTEHGYAMIREWLNGQTDERSVFCCARYMSQTLRIGGMKVCRRLINEAINSAQ